MGLFGQSAFGLSPFAASGPDAALGPGGLFVLVPTVYRATAAQVRQIYRGDYILETVGPRAGSVRKSLAPLAEEAAFRLGTVKGTFAGVKTIGTTLFSITTAVSTSIVDVQRAVQLALQPMIDRGAIRDLLVTATISESRGTGQLTWTARFSPTGLAE